ncbi:hypothetical protein NX871_31125, partial [Burkholderia thailandensis]|nr:hypothetical protein [Burkholderia thailandensis]
MGRTADVAGSAGRLGRRRGKIAAFACHSGRPADCSAPRPAARAGRSPGARMPVVHMPAARTFASSMTESDLQSDDTTIHEDGLWHDNGWTARIIKNEDDDGWAVEMIKDGE